jgi:hypothetical protein
LKPISRSNLAIECSRAHNVNLFVDYSTAVGESKDIDASKDMDADAHRVLADCYPRAKLIDGAFAWSLRHRAREAT